MKTMKQIFVVLEAADNNFVALRAESRDAGEMQAREALTTHPGIYDR